MDTKRLVTGMLLAMAIVIGWQQFYVYLAKKNNWKLPGQTPEVVNTQSGTGTGPDAGTTQPATTQTAVATQIGPAPVVGMRAVESTEVSPSTTIGSAAKEDPTYSVQLDISPSGAGLNAVIL